MRKYIKRILITLTVVTGVLLLYLIAVPVTQVKTFNAIPYSSMVTAANSYQPVQSYQKIRSNPFFEQYHLSERAEKWVNRLDTFLHQYPSVLSWLIDNRNTTLSYHKGGELLMIVDLQQWSRLTGVGLYVATSLSNRVQQQTPYDTEVKELFTLGLEKRKVYGYVYENLLVLATTESLQNASINALRGDNLYHASSFQYVEQDKGDIQWYIDLEKTDRYLNPHIKKESVFLEAIADDMVFASSTIDISPNLDLSGKGALSLSYSKNSRLTTSLVMGNPSGNSAQLIPKSASLYVNLSTEGLLFSFKKMQEVNPTFQNNITVLKDKFGIDLANDFNNWVGNDLAFVQHADHELGGKNELAVFIELKNKEEAKTKLDFISQHTRRNTLQRFGSLNYRNYTIGYIPVKGLLEMVLGSFFQRIERPYYTIINDFVIFANHPVMLKRIIDDFESDNTLAQSDVFTNKTQQPNTCLSVFMQGAPLFDHLPKVFQYNWLKKAQAQQDLLMSTKSFHYHLIRGSKSLKADWQLSYQSADEGKVWLNEIAKERALEDANQHPAVLDKVVFSDSWQAFELIIPQASDTNNMISVE